MRDINVDLSMLENPGTSTAGISCRLVGDNDAEIKSGPHSGTLVSELARTEEGRDYLVRIWKLASDDMRDILRRFFD